MDFCVICKTCSLASILNEYEGKVYRRKNVLEKYVHSSSAFLTAAFFCSTITMIKCSRKGVYNPKKFTSWVENNLWNDKQEEEIMEK